MAKPPIYLRKDERGNNQKYFQRGRFLSIEEIAEELAKKENRENLRMLKYITERRLNPVMQTMGRYRARFSVSQLQHVTGERGFQGITRDQRFTGNLKNISETEKPDKKRFSWWGVVFPKKELKPLKDKAFEDLSKNNHLISSQIENRQVKVRNLFANSPLFQEGSRYGNYKFLFPVEKLLERYEEQHCTRGGGTLVFRVLGTWTFQQEILHAVLIHSSEFNDEFSDLPKITGNSKEPIYRWQGRTFRCNLESSSDKFTLLLSPTGIEDRMVRCVWNNPAFAFYLPQETGLAMPIRNLNPKLCKSLKPGRGNAKTFNEAEKLIKEFDEK